MALDLATLEIDKIDHNIIRRYLVHLNEKCLAKSTVARRLAALRSFYKYLLRKELIAQNPLRNVSTPKIPQRLPKYLEQNEMALLLHQPSDSEDAGIRDKAILELLYGSGIRVSELVGLDLESIDTTYGYVRAYGKGGRERLVPVGKKAAAAVDRYLAVSRPRWDCHKIEALFLNQQGGRLSDRSVRNIVRKYCLAAGTKEIVSPHGFRHSFASHLLDNGADLRVVQELLGHKKISSTQIYTHVSRSKLRKIYHLTHPRA